MKTFIDEEAPKTEGYIKYILAKLVERLPLREKEVVEIEVNESSTPFPKISETADSYADEKFILEDADHVKARTATKVKALNEYHQDRFGDLFALVNPDSWQGTKPRIRLKLVVTNPEKIYAECKKYGVEITDADNFLKDANPAMAKFYNDPPRIIWNGEVVPIEYDSLQKDICDYAFDRPVKEPISWDLVIKKVDKNRETDPKKGRQSIYYAVYRLNRRIEKFCRKPLFVWQKKSFYRVA